MTEIKVGDKAPDFSLPSQSGEVVRLRDYEGKKNVVLYFYPKDFTLGCTAEAKAFRDSYPMFSDAQTEVIGVSADAVHVHQRFAQQCSLQFRLLSDVGRQVKALYGVESRLGMGGRVTFVIDKSGIIRNIFSSRLRPTKHVAEALKSLEADRREQVKSPPRSRHLTMRTLQDA